MPWISRLARVYLLGALVVSVGCAGNPQRSPVQVPPRLDLGEWGTIGIVEFDGGSDPELAEQATRQFVQMLQAAQPGARILELGDERRVLTKLGHDELDFETVRALGERYRVDAVFTGLLELGEVKPQIRFGQALATLRARADVTGHLAAKLLETHAGALVWSRSSTAKANVARLGVPISGLPSFGAQDPTDTHAGLIQRLVAELRYDFYPTWE